MFKRLKRAIGKFLEDLAKENKELYGSGRMDCCQINKKTNDKPTANHS